LKLTRFIRAPENRSAVSAFEYAAACIGAGRWAEVASPLYIHGGTGTGKTRLVTALCEEIGRTAPRSAVSRLEAADFENQIEAAHRGSEESEELLAEVQASDVLIFEDLHQFGGRPAGCKQGAIEALIFLLDSFAARQKLVVITACVGPNRLTQFNWRLATRLGAGLILNISPLQTESRLLFLQSEAQRCQLAVGQDVLVWLASHLTGGGRQLQGAIVQLQALTRLHKRILNLATVQEQFQPQAEAARPTAERVAQCVAGYFCVQARQLQTRRRYQNMLLPRQIGMYLARTLTALSLKEIGAYFGGRDHSTVLHACRKIEKDLRRDPVLSGIVGQLRAELT
jgi:chromosomal replication initiator protein